MALPILALVVAAQGPEVSVKTLLPQMWDMSHLTKPASPAYTAAQASSYDRASDPGPNQDWFANGDAGKYLRVEERNGRKEYVMADLKGPGAVVRIWSANPTGVMRFYFDGETTPRLESDCGKLLTGGDPRFPDPFSYIASQGTNLYFPLPYAKSLKVTLDDRDGANKPGTFYYHVNYRTYADGTRVRTFDASEMDRAKAEMAKTSSALKGFYSTVRASRGGPKSTIEPGKNVVVLDKKGPGSLSRLTFRIPFPLVQTVRAMDWQDPHQPHNVLRNLILRIDFDGQRSVETPLGDFFATAPGLVNQNNLAFTTGTDGTMTCKLPMPYAKSIRISVNNLGSVPVPLVTEHVAGPAPKGNDFYRLHAQWTVEDGQSRPFKDLEFLDVKGEGYWLGSMLHIANSSPAWWGEGDEKVYVDGETFPSTFGTGTEDYYGYAWCSPELFQRAYHAQPYCDGPANFGHTNVNRFHIVDPIPYRKSMKFDIERWHWEDVPSTFARVAYWYAKPGGTTPRPINRRLLLPPKMEPPKPVEGAIEGEKMDVVEMTGGVRENQGGFWGLSSGLQLWWREPQVGNRLRLRLPVKEAGTYEVVGNFCHAGDYGIHRIKVNGKDAGTHDFYGEGVNWKRISLGTMTLPAGNVEIEVEAVGANPKARPGRLFGLDYILLNKK
ncbi:MAG: DUF2961 domain-containing protein [Fimbriimonas sp.]